MTAASLERSGVYVYEDLDRKEFPMINRRLVATILILSCMLTGCDLMTETHWLVKPS